MMLAGPQLRVTLATIHLALREMLRQLTVDAHRLGGRADGARLARQLRHPARRGWRSPA